MLIVSEIFVSLQGETSFSGRPSTFVRLSGCNLHCRWCDTVYAREAGEPWEIEKIVEYSGKGPELVSITGGEPLLQAETPELVSRLIDEGHQVIVETNGSLPIDILDGRAFRMVDLKSPSSGESEQICWKNMDFLSAGDEVKIVIADSYDFSWAKKILKDHSELRKFPVNLSPACGLCSGRELAEWILEEGLEVRLNLQLHRILWPDCNKGH